MFSFIRIFHQVHRNTLIILTLNIDEFYAALMLYPLTIKPSLPEIVLPNEAMSPEEYKGTIDRFNQLFAPDMRIELGELTDHLGVSGQDSYLITTQATKSMDVRPHLIAVGDHNDIGKQLADSLKSELGSEEIIIRNNASDVKYMTIVELKSDFSKPFIVATCINDEKRENSSQEEAVIILGEENQESIVQALLKYKK